MRAGDDSTSTIDSGDGNGPSPAPPVHAQHESLISVLLMVVEACDSVAEIRRIESALAGTAHELLVVYSAEAEAAVLQIEETPQLARRLRMIKAEGREEAGALRAGIGAAAGDVIAPVVAGAGEDAGAIPGLAEAVRSQGAAIAVLTEPRGRRRLHRIDFLLGSVAGIGVWNAATGLRAYGSDFLEREPVESESLIEARVELLVKAQLAHDGICAVKARERAPAVEARAEVLRGVEKWARGALVAPACVWGLWALMTAPALLTLAFTGTPRDVAGNLANAAFPAAGAFAFILAVRRIRGRTRLADCFFPLVLLNPLFYAERTGPFDPTLLAAGTLGLMAGAIIAMKRDDFLRYLAVAVLAMALTLVSDSFIMLLPPLVAWMLWAGYLLVRSREGRERVRGLAVLAAAEIGMVTFGLACILIEPTAMPPARSLFANIVGFVEFPLLVLAIVMLGLGWRSGPGGGGGGEAPPYFAGMLALLVGLLGMLLNNFQAGSLAAPGADQTVLILCLVYTVFALHAPRRLHWIAPPVLLACAVAYTFFRWRAG